MTLLAATLTGLVLLIALIGTLLPRTHRATRTAVFRRQPAEIFAAIHDFAAMPTWRSGLTGVEILPPQDGHASFRELTSHRPVTYIVLEDRPPDLLVTRIEDEKLPFGGTWTYALAAENGGTRLRITEDGEIRNTLFRFLSRFVFGYTATIDTYLRDLGGKFGETVTPGA